MTRTYFATAVTALILGLAPAALGQNARPTPTPTSDVYVTAEFLNVGTDNTPSKITMDVSGNPYSHGVSGVEARFFAGGSRDLVVRLVNSTRYAIFNLTEVSSPLNSPAWTSTPQWFRPGMNVLEAYRAKENCTPSGGIYNCNLITRMNAGFLSVSGDSATYALLWNPETTNNRPVNSPESTSWVNVNYYRGLDNVETFTISPLPNCATRANNWTCPVGSTQRVIAGLERTKGKSVTGTGQYVMPFTMVVRPK